MVTDMSIVLDRKNPKSLINLASPHFAKIIDDIPEEYFLMPETDLIQKVYGLKVPEIDSKLRLSLWREYDDQLKASFIGKLSIPRIVRGLCHASYFNKVLCEPGRVAFLLCQPAEYWTALEDILHLGISEMRRIMELKEQVNGKTGLVDTKLLDLKFKIWQHVDARQRGAITQRIEQRSQNLNVSMKATTEDLDKFRSVEDIDKRLLELEADKLLQPGQLPEPEIVLPVERVVREAGRVNDLRFKDAIIKE